MVLSQYDKSRELNKNNDSSNKIDGSADRFWRIDIPEGNLEVDILVGQMGWLYHLTSPFRRGQSFAHPDSGKQIGWSQDYKQEISTGSLALRNKDSQRNVSLDFGEDDEDYRVYDQLPDHWFVTNE